MICLSAKTSTHLQLQQELISSSLNLSFNHNSPPLQTSSSNLDVLNSRNENRFHNCHATALNNACACTCLHLLADPAQSTDLDPEALRVYFIVTMSVIGFTLCCLCCIVPCVDGERARTAGNVTAGTTSLPPGQASAPLPAPAMRPSPNPVVNINVGATPVGNTILSPMHVVPVANKRLHIIEIPSTRHVGGR